MWTKWSAEFNLRRDFLEDDQKSDHPAHAIGIIYERFKWIELVFLIGGDLHNLFIMDKKINKIITMWFYLINYHS